MKGSRSAHARSRGDRGETQKNQSMNRDGAHSAFTYISTKPYRERKADVIKNLEFLEVDNVRLDDFMKRLGVLNEKIKHNGALLKHAIATECDNLVKVIEKRKRAMVSTVDRAQAVKVRRIENQLTDCRRLFSTGHSVIVRTNRDLQHLSMPAFLKKSENLIDDIVHATREQPDLVPAEDERYDYLVDFTEQRDALDIMELTESVTPRDDTRRQPSREQSRESKSQSSTRSPRDSNKGTTKKKPFIEKLMDEEGEEEKREKRRKDATKERKQKEQRKTAEKNTKKDQKKTQKKKETVQFDESDDDKDRDTKNKNREKEEPEDVTKSREEKDDQKDETDTGGGDWSQLEKSQQDDTDKESNVNGDDQKRDEPREDERDVSPTAEKNDDDSDDKQESNDDDTKADDDKEETRSIKSVKQSASSTSLTTSERGQRKVSEDTRSVSDINQSKQSIKTSDEQNEQKSDTEMVEDNESIAEEIKRGDGDVASRNEPEV